MAPVGAARQSDFVVGSPGGLGFTCMCERFREGRLDMADSSLFSTRLPVSTMMLKRCVDFEIVLCCVL